jgi:IS30 family transposase
LTAADLKRVEDLLKNRPVKALNYHPPNEAFAKITAPPEIYALGM